MNNAESNHSTRTLADIATEMKQELKEFIETRIAIFKTELGEKLAHWKIACPIGRRWRSAPEHSVYVDHTGRCGTRRSFHRRYTVPLVLCVSGGWRALGPAWGSV